jgi:hypothetical protein
VPVIAAIHGACVGGGVDLICAADIRCVACISVSGAPLLCLSLPPCRLASSDAWFSIMETRLGLAADVGTLQAPAQPSAAMCCTQRTPTPHAPCSACPASSATPLLHVNGRSHRAGSQLMRCIAHTALAHLLPSPPFLQALQAGLLSRYTPASTCYHSPFLTPFPQRAQLPCRPSGNPFSFTPSFMLYRGRNLRSQARALALAKEIAGNSPVAVAGTKANLNYSRCERAGRNVWRAFTRSHFTRGVRVFTFCAPEATDGAPSCLS